MTQEHKSTGDHPTDVALADYLDRLLTSGERKAIEAHLAVCDDCLAKTVCAYESVKTFNKNIRSNKRKAKYMGKMNLYLILAIVSFVLSFIVPRFFLQFLAATLLLGIKWVADSKTTKMLVMIHEAWKNNGERGASEVIKRLDPHIKSRI